MATSETIARTEAYSGGRSADIGQALALILAGLFIFFSIASGGIPDAMRLALQGSDDSLRLMSVRGLVGGQGWFDMTLYRFMPPEGVVMHWSRLVDLPMAGAILALTPIVGADMAEKLTVTAWPLFLFVVYCTVLGFGVWRLFGARAAGLAVFVAAQMIVFAELFAPARIDHHNVQVILISVMAFGFGSAWRDARSALVSGAFGALSLAVGLETVPLVALVGAAFVVAWIAGGERSSRPLLYFGGALGAAALAFFLVQTAPKAWAEPRCDALSIPWLLLTTVGGGAAVVLAMATRRLPTVWHRTVAAGILGAVPVIGFCALFPECLSGPVGSLPERYRELLLAETLETFRFARFLAVNPSAALQSFVPMVAAACVATLAAWRAAPEGRPFLAIAASLLWLGVAMSLIEVRGLYITSALIPPVAGWFLDRLIAGRVPRGALARISAAVAGLAMFGIVWAFVVPAIEAMTPGTAAAAPQRADCADPRYLNRLDALPPGVIVAPYDLDSRILVHTRHSIVVAGFAWSVPAIVAGVDAFDGDEADMRRVVDTYHADYLAICPNWLAIFAPGSESFAKQLADGRTVAWLQPLNLATGPLKVWRVVKNP